MNINATANQFIISRREILKNFIVDSGSIKKRSALLATLGGFIFSGALMGITEVQIKRINNHVRENSEEISRLAEKLRLTSEREILFEKASMAYLKKTAYETDLKLKFAFCLEEMDNYYFNARSYLFEFQKSINTIFEAQLKGRNFEKLNAEIIDPYSLKNITLNHPIFRNTLYRTHPSLLYNVAKITLIAVERSLDSAHFVLSFPLITPTSEYPLYKFQQTGVLLHGGLCATLVAPSLVYENKGKFYEVNLKHCDSHFNFHICPSNAFSVYQACFQPQSITCNTTRTTCASYHKAIELPSGILLRNNIRHDTFCRGIDDKTSIVKLTEHFTAFVSWDNCTHVQVADILFTSPAVPGTHITFKNFSTNFSFSPDPSLEPGFMATFEEFASQHNMSLTDILESSLATNHPKSRNLNSIYIFVIIGFGVSFAVLSFCATILAVYYHRKHTNISREQAAFLYRPANRFIAQPSSSKYNSL